MSKSTGSFYTPKKLSTFIWTRILENFDVRSHLHILEPSCGDGVFLKVISEHQVNKSLSIDAIEINVDALKKAKENLVSQNGHLKINWIRDDFLEIKLSTKYDIVIGNPPYIGRNLLSERQKYLCQQIHKEGGIDNKSIRNIWTAFLIKSVSLLKPTGMLALILPGEFLQVNYAKEIQSFLEENFQLIEILTFQELVFPALGQDVAVIFAYKESQLPGLGYTQVTNVNSLDKVISFPKRIINTAKHNIKWSGFVLTDSDLEFLVKEAQKIKKVSEYCTSTPGIVTAANKFFIVNKQTAIKYGLMDYCEPILQKSEFISQTICFDHEAFVVLEKTGKPCFLLNLNDINESTLPKSVQNYLREGLQQNIHLRFKTKERSPWYNIPSVWVPKCVFFKRSHIYPKLLKNEANVLFTDTAYRIRPNENCDINSFIYSFYNSLTLTFCELNGRFYGGGVLELTPKEFQSLPIPYQSITGEEYGGFQETFAKSTSLDQILQQNDELLLEKLGLTKSSVLRIRQIYQKLLMGRLKNKMDQNNTNQKETPSDEIPS